MVIGIIGLGLIGGSLGRAITARTEHRVLGYDNDDKTMAKAELLKAFSEPINENNIREIELLIIALPPRAVEKVMSEIAPLIGNGAAVIDCTGNKRGVTASMRELSNQYPQLKFFGGHPMAGREYSGVRHSSQSLFDNASMIITPVTSDLPALRDIKNLFIEIGFKEIVITSPEEHDMIISYTSQLAHIVSSAYVLSPTAGSYRGFSAGSFRDMTRVSRMNAEMWADLFIDNADNITRELDEIIGHLKEYRALIDAKDADGLKSKLEKGNCTRINLDKLKNK